MIDRLQLPQKVWEFVPEDFPFRQPVEELERYAERKSLSFSSPGLGMAQTIWNRELGPFQSIMGLSYVMTGSTVAGILGQIRTRLVDLIADLTSDTPLSELPKKDRVDAAVTERIGPVRDVYNMTIHAAGGPTAIGARAKATTVGVSVEDALRLLREVQKAASDVAEGRRAELEGAVAELRATLEGDHPETGEVVKKVGKLRAVAEKLGVASVSAATGGVTQALTELAVSGAFG